VAGVETNMALLDWSVAAGVGESVVSVRGEVDAYSVDGLRACLDDLVTGGEHQIVVDLSELAYIDSAGIGLLATTLRRLRQGGGDLVLRSPTTGTFRLLEITGLADRFRIIDAHAS